MATTSCIPNNIVSVPKPALEFLMFASLDVSRILSCLGFRGLGSVCTLVPVFVVPLIVTVRADSICLLH